MVAQWDTIRANFLAGVEKIIETKGKRAMLKRDREKLLRELTARIPTAQEYRARAKMEVTVRAFPSTGGTATGLAPDLQDLVDQTWKDDVTANIVRSIESNLGEIFAKACTIATDYGKTGKVNTRSLNTLVRSASRVKKMNVFANPMLEKLAGSLSAITNDDMDRAEWQVEEAIVDAWNYARSTGITLDMALCPFDEKALESMLAARSVAPAIGA